MLPALIPIIGGAVSGIASLAGGAMEAAAAKKQAEQAKRMRDAANKIKAQKMQEEFGQKLRMDKATALQGLPNMEQSIEQLDANTAGTTRAIKESSPSGAGTLAAISAQTQLQNSALQNLQNQDAQMRLKGMQNVAQTVGDIGVEKQQLQDYANKLREQGLQGASAMEAASTYNKQNAANKMLGAASIGLSTALKGGADIGIANQEDMAKTKEFANNYFTSKGITTPTEQDLIEAATKLGIDIEKLKKAYQ
jgi:chemotaxis protein histidine kinase CheA